jgi:two-component system CheB/CheR fusion protein
MTRDERPVRLVILALPAGGAEAGRRILVALPADFPAPVLWVGPPGPDPAGLPLPVVTLAGEQPLQPGTVHVVPAGCDAEVSGAGVALHPRTEAEAGPRLAPLLAGAAVAFGDALVAVVLAGTGAQGAEGSRAVARRGGTVITDAVSEQAAAPPADVVSDLDQIGRLLVSLARGEAPGAAGSPREMEGVLARVRRHSGVDWSGYKPSTLLRQVRRRMAITRTRSVAEYQGYLDEHPEECQRLLASFLVKVTGFFRDPDLHAYLRQRVLPAVIEQARSTGREIRIWSAGCATGEEAYSLAILVREALGAEIDAFQVRIFATDLDAEAVSFARRGVYPAAALERVDPNLLGRHFHPENGHFAVDQRLRSLVVFGVHDLGQRPPFPRTDLVLCRNVLIYFTPELQKRALHLFAFSLRPGGFLVLGRAETVAPAAEPFEAENGSLKVYVRRNTPVPIPWLRFARPGLASPKAGPGTEAQRVAALEASAAAAPAGTEPDTDLSLCAPVGMVVVDARYDILEINGAARDLLGVRVSAIGHDLVHLARATPAKELRRLMDGALRRGETTQAAAVPVEDPLAPATRYVDLTCRPLPSAGGEARAILTVSDVTHHVAALRQAEAERDRERRLRQEALARLEQMADAAGELREANDQLASENASLRRAAAAVMLGREDLQAAHEEAETLNEELQASNEELETLNEELQATVEELNAANEDLQARAVELQELAASREAQRARAEEAKEWLEAVLASTAAGVVVVDREGSPVMANPSYVQIRQAAEGGSPPRGLDGRPIPSDGLPERRAARGESFHMHYVVTDREGNLHWYEAVGDPVRAGPRGPAAAGIVLFRDLTDRALRELQDEFLATASHELRTPLTAMALYAGLLAQLGESRAPDDRYRALLASLTAEMRRANLLVGDLMDASRLQSGRLSVRREPVELGALLRRVTDLAGQMGAGPAIRLQLPQEPVQVSADPDRIEQVLLNLLDNARRYAAASDAVDVRLRAADGWAEVDVEDRGPGIPPAELARLFTRFYQRPGPQGPAQSGLGLGLYIARQIARAHGGDIEVRSAEGRGSTFTVRLPLEQP